ncbi:unnamed protein product [Sympodiomycopsis kandeliae]
MSTLQVPEGTLLPPTNTPLWLKVSHQGQDHRIGPIQCARSFSCNELKWKLTRRFALQKERFQIFWIDDDNHQSDIQDDESLYESIDYFTPSQISANWIRTSSNSQTGSSSSSTNSEGSASSIVRTPIEIHIQIRLFSRITLSDFAPSSAGSSYDDHGSSAAWDTDGEEEEEGDWYGSQRYETADDIDAGSHRAWSEDVVSVGSSQSRDRDSSTSRSSSAYRPPLNGKDRLASLHSYTDDDEEEEDQGTEYAFSAGTDGLGRSQHKNSRGRIDGRSFVMANATANIHHGVVCIVCKTYPIKGTRYMCVMCDGLPNFCGDCEDGGRAIQHAPHLATHAVLRLVHPIADTLGSPPHGTSHPRTEIGNVSRNTHQPSLATTLSRAARFLSISPPRDEEVSEEQSVHQDNSKSSSPPPVTYGHNVLCSFCSERIVDGPRYLCANCPLDVSNVSSASTPHEGFNLCYTCHEHSLSIHDSEHFFLKIPGSASIARSSSEGGITPLHLNPYLTVDHRTQGLLPTLYQGDDHDWIETKRRMLLDTPPTAVANGRSQDSSDQATSQDTVQATGLSQRADPSTSTGNPFESSNETVGRQGRAGGSRFGLCRSRTLYDDIELAKLRQHAANRQGVDDLVFPQEDNGADAIAMTTKVIHRPAPPPWTPAGASVNMRPPAPFFRRQGSDNSSTSSNSSGSSTTTGSAAPLLSNSNGNGNHESHEATYVKTLQHKNLMCDLCFEPIRGCWLRCVNCKHSFDICQACEHESMTVHELNHTFAVFKRHVDLDLFKSLVDHVDDAFANTTYGPGRAMVPFLLV